MSLQEQFKFHAHYLLCASVCMSQHSTSAGNSLLSTVCSDPQALLSPQWKWNWHNLNLSCRGPPFSADQKSKRTYRSMHHNLNLQISNPFKRMKCSSSRRIRSYHCLVFVSSSKKRKLSHTRASAEDGLFRH